MNQEPEYNVVDQLPDQYSLVNYSLARTWKLVRLLHAGIPDTGSNFGTGYVAAQTDDKNPDEVFVKVIDYRRGIDDPTALATELSLVEFEKNILRLCRDRRLSKVVRLLDDGMIWFKKQSTGETYSFMYIVMECGDGDIKSHVDYSVGGDCRWKLTVLSDIALALTQLDRLDLSHNDVKPANVISFHTRTTAPHSTLGDVGRVVTRDGLGPYNGCKWPGDPAYRPFEFHYGVSEAEWQDRRTSADAFMLGNLLCFLFAGVSLTERVFAAIPTELKPLSLKGSYTGAYYDVVDEGHPLGTYRSEPKKPGRPAITKTTRSSGRSNAVPQPI